MQSRISSSHAGPVKDNTSTSLLLPAIIVSVLLNLTSGWLILSTFMETPNTRKENPVSEVQLPVYQDREEPEYGEKIKNKEDMKDVEDKFVDRSGEQRFDNQHLQDMYLELPRSFLPDRNIYNG